MFPIVIQHVVLARYIENILGLGALQNLIDGIELFRFRKVADVPRMQHEFRRRRQSVDFVHRGFQCTHDIRLKLYEFSTPPFITQKAPVPAHAMHFRKPRRSIPSWLWSCRSSSFFFSDILALHTYFFYAVSKLCTCRWGWRRGMVWGLPAPPLNVLASIQTEAAPLLFQILRVHVSLCMSVTTEPRRE